MLEENFVLALLQASVTGAGLILAIYALIVPVYRRIFSNRAEGLYEDLHELKESVLDTDTNISQEKIDEMKEILNKIEGQRDIPEYLRWIAGATFLLYSASTLISVWWVLDWNKSYMDSWLPISFGLSTILFIIVGILAIKDISQTMKKEFEDLKKEVEEAKSQVKRKTR